VGLRSLSALAGTASIAVVYLGAVSLPLPRRAGLVAAAIVAVSPALIWFSQDARAYALVFLLTALSFLFFARARRSGGPLRPAKAVVTARHLSNEPLVYFLGGAIASGPLPPLREIDLVGSKGAAERNAPRLLPAGFHRVESKPVSYDFTLTRYRSKRRVRVPLRLLERGALVGDASRASVIVTPPSP